jgi:hypothetical protein
MGAESALNFYSSQHMNYRTICQGAGKMAP